MSKTWILDGGPKRFALTALAVGTVVVLIIGAVLLSKYRMFSDSVQSVRATQGQSATVSPGDANVDAARPDVLAASRDGLSRWLAGDTGAMTPEAAANAPAAPVGSSLADGGAVLVSSDSYSATSVPLLVEQTNVTATVELTWDDASGWLITNFVVS